MARPAGHEWQPLGLDADPVPGDPSRISDEIAHLSAMASEISRQVDGPARPSGLTRPMACPAPPSPTPTPSPRSAPT